MLKDKTSMQKSANGYLYSYTLMKGNFIRSILKETGSNRIQMLKDSDKTEWQAIKHFRDKYYGIDDLNRISF